MTVYLDYEGAPVPIEDCSRLLVAPCGCVPGISTATAGNDLIVTPEQALAEFVENAEQRRRDIAAGWSTRLAGPDRQAASRQMTPECPHTPMWGREPLPALDGYKWAADGSKGKRSHLVLEEKLDTFVNSRALCGNESWGWRNGWPARELPSCRRCESQARAQGGAS